jgi:hypothetical protein
VCVVKRYRPVYIAVITKEGGISLETECRWENNVKINVKEIIRGCVNWMQMAKAVE